MHAMSYKLLLTIILWGFWRYSGLKHSNLNLSNMRSRRLASATGNSLSFSLPPRLWAGSSPPWPLWRTNYVETRNIISWWHPAKNHYWLVDLSNTFSESTCFLHSIRTQEYFYNIERDATGSYKTNIFNVQ